MAGAAQRASHIEQRLIRAGHRSLCHECTEVVSLHSMLAMRSAAMLAILCAVGASSRMRLGTHRSTCAACRLLPHTPLTGANPAAGGLLP